MTAPGDHGTGGNPGPDAGVPVLDAEVLAGLESLGAALVSDVVTLWTEQLPVSLDGIRAGLDAGDALAAAAAAHGLRGSSANVGAARLAAACAALERTAKADAGSVRLEEFAAVVTTQAEVARDALAATVAELEAQETGRR